MASNRLFQLLGIIAFSSAVLAYAPASRAMGLLPPKVPQGAEESAPDSARPGIKKEESGGYKGTVGIFCVGDKNEIVYLSPEMTDDPNFDACARKYFRQMVTAHYSSGRGAKEQDRVKDFLKAFGALVQSVRALSVSNSESVDDRE